MLPRILEAEVMDSPEEARDYDAMDHQAVNEVFVTDFLQVWNGQGPILDVGTGTAQIPIHLCSRRADAEVIAIDMAENMLDLGRANVRQSGFADRIRLERRDAKQLPYAAGAFGAVISNSIVHHIPEPAKVLAEMIRVARAGAVLFVRDLLRPPDAATVGRLVAAYAGNANDHQRQMFDDSLRAALTLEEIQSLVGNLGINPVTVRQTTDRHWTWSAVRDGKNS